MKTIKKASMCIAKHFKRQFLIPIHKQATNKEILLSEQ